MPGGRGSAAISKALESLDASRAKTVLIAGVCAAPVQLLCSRSSRTVQGGGTPDCNGEGNLSRHLVLLRPLICAAQQPGKSSRCFRETGAAAVGFLL